MLDDVRVSFSEDEASPWNAFVDEEHLGGRSSSLGKQETTVSIVVVLHSKHPHPWQEQKHLALAQHKEKSK